MPTVHPSDAPIVARAVSALTSLSTDRTISGDGFGNSKIGALANPGTVTNLLAGLAALAGFHQADSHIKTLGASAVKLAAAPLFPLTPIVTSSTGSTSGGSLATGTYQIRVTGFDRNGRESAPSAATTGNVASGSSGSIPVVIPSQAGYVKYRVYYSAAGGAAGSEDEYLESTATAGITTGNVTVTLTTRTVGGGVVSGTPPTTGTAGVGTLSDLGVEQGRAASLIATTRNAVADQHPDGTAARTLNYGIQNTPFVA